MCSPQAAFAERRRPASGSGPMDALPFARTGGTASLSARLYPGLGRPWHAATPQPSPISCAAASRGVPSFRPARRSSAFRAPAGIGRRLPTTALWPHPRYRLRSDVPFDIPQGTFFRSRSRSSPTLSHPFEADNAAIEANWQRERAEPPFSTAAWCCCRALPIGSGALAGTCHIVRYASSFTGAVIAATRSAGARFAHAAR